MDPLKDTFARMLQALSDAELTSLSGALYGEEVYRSRQRIRDGVIPACLYPEFQEFRFGSKIQAIQIYRQRNPQVSIREAKLLFETEMETVHSLND